MNKYTLHQGAIRMLLAAVVILVLTGCGTPTPSPNQPPVIQGNIIVSPATVPVGGRATVTVIATDPDGDNVVYYWEARKGSVPASAQGDTVVYIAPETSGLDTVTVTVNDGRAVAKQEVQISVIGPTPTPIETLSPTSTSEPPTDTPMPFTDTPTSMQPSIPTDTPTPTFTTTPSVVIVDSVVYCTDNGEGGTETIPVEPPCTVARIRIDMKERATEHGNSLWEVEAYGPDAGNTNLITGGEARASSAQDSFGCEGCFAHKAIDSDPNTRWSSDWHDPQWLEITLPGLQVINRIVLKWEAAYAKRYCVTVAGPVTPTPTLAPCPPADAEGTVPPAIAISSITFIVNGVEQVVRDADALQASPGDQVQVKEVTICPVDPFGDSGGQVYVGFDPVDQNGQVIAAEVKSTQAVEVTPGFKAIPGPSYTWTIGDNWRHISVVTVHYPPGGGTQNPNCEGGACEVDDRMIVGIQ